MSVALQQRRESDRFLVRHLALDLLLARELSARTQRRSLAEREGFEPSKGFWPLHP
jgi:hypothetical protein